MDGVGDVFSDRLGGLSSKGGRLYFAVPDEDEPVAVTARYLRPLSARTEVAFLDEKQHEVASVRGLEALDASVRPDVEQELRERYHLTTIRRVVRIHVQFGTRYWDVDTDRGRRSFALREPGKNVLWLSERHLVLRDTAGNRYEVPDVSTLDRASRKWGTRAL